MRRRLLSLLLAIVLVLGMLPVSAFAEEIPFSVTLNDVALEIEGDGNYPLPDQGVEIPAYKIKVPSNTAEDATVSLSGESIFAVATLDGATPVEKTQSQLCMTAAIVSSMIAVILFMQSAL